MKTTKTMKAVAFVCAAVICLAAVPAAAQEINGDNDVAMEQDLPGNAADQNNDEGLTMLAVAGGIVSYVVTPWCTMEALTLLNTGIGMIGDAVIPGYYDNPTKKEAVILAETN